MTPDMQDALIGQMAADAALLQALTAALSSISPQIQQAIERKAEAAALFGKRNLSEAQRAAFDQRLTELRPLWQ